MSDSLWPHGLQHTRLPCLSLSPKVCSNSCPLSQWCHPTISSSVTPFSSCPQSFPASGSFAMSQLFISSDQSIGASVTSKSVEGRHRPAIVHSLTVGASYLSCFCLLVSIIQWYLNVVLVSISDYQWVSAFVHLLITYQGFLFWERPWDIFSPFFYQFSLSLWVGLKGFFVYSRNYSFHYFRHWKYLPPPPSLSTID